MASREETFAKTLYSLYENFYEKDFVPEEYGKRVLSSLIEIFGDDQGFQKCQDLLEFGSDIANIKVNEREYGFKLKSQEYSYLPNMLNRLERLPIPELIYDICPDITPDEWQAVIRFVTMILTAFSPTK